ncbi:MAG: FAD-binding oxidoreductase [Anaerolineales bacterium]|nr:FAD-binding oxidoreductase [Anaerolineales bacterium]
MTTIPKKADIVICGAGIAGIAAAYFLTVRHGIREVVLVDERPFLSLTSDKSTEAYRNWWPGPGDAMVRLMDRSIDLLEELAAASDNFFHLNRRGYVYLTADQNQAAQMRREAETIAGLGAGQLRMHPNATPYQSAPGYGYRNQPGGADWISDPVHIQTQFPFIADDVVALLHTRRCGWLSAQQLGMHLLSEAKKHGARLVKGRITDVTIENGRITAVELNQTEIIHTNIFINAAGPLIKQVGAMLGVDLPVYNELHGKISFEDTHGIIPRDVPLMIWNDPMFLPWSAEERADLAEFEDTAWLLEQFPAGIHFRPEGGPGAQTLLVLWPYHIKTFATPIWPIQIEPEYVEVVMRGLTRMVPGISVYLERLSKPYVDGGYYCKTRENRPLICPLPVVGAYIIGALSGYGIMAATGAGELLSALVTGSELPGYAPAFHLDRYQDPAYRQLLAGWSAVAGQL